MMSWMDPRQLQTFAGRTAPSGWQGSWPPVAPVGFSGPPPPPPGVDPNAWYGGQWQFNPMYRAAPAPQAPAWAPHPSWGVPAVPSQNYNPYKRVPNRGDADYWNTKLLENPLGLENMIPKEELDKQAAEAQAPQTPWLWVPKELSKSDERHEYPHDSRDGHGVRDSQDSRRSSREQPSQPLSASAASNTQYMQQQQQRHYHSQSQPSQAQQQSTQRPAQSHRSQAQPPYSSSNNNQPNGRSRDPDVTLRPAPSAVPASAPASVSTYSAYYQQQQRQQQTQRSESRPPPESTPTPQPPQPSRTPTHTVSASSQARSQENDKGSAFSAHQELKPTFSASIVRTPNHYSVSSASAAASGTPTRKSSVRKGSRDEYQSGREDRSSFSPRRDTGRSRSRYKERDDSSDDESPPRRSHVHGPIYAPPTPTPGHTRASSTATSPTRSSTAPSRESSIASLASSMTSLSVDTAPTSASSTTYLTTFSDEPGILSPILVGGPTPNKSSPRESSSLRSSPRDPNKHSPRDYNKASPRDVNKYSPREVTRSQTYPLLSSSSQTIPEERSTPPLSRTPSQKTPRRSPGMHKKSPSTLGRSQTHPNMSFDNEPPVIPPMPSPSFMGRSPSPSRSAARNPLPVPPMPSSYPVSSASASASAMSQESQRRRTQSQFERSGSSSHNAAPTSSSRTAQYEHPTPSSHHTSSSSSSRPTHAPSGGYSSQSQSQRKVRRGFWNRRGDHLVIVPSSSSHSPSSPSNLTYGKQYIVYAPRGWSNPAELAHYPSPTDGWMDHRGRTIRYDPSVPELPDSLPRHGEPPRKPYEQFIEYTYV